MEALTRWCAETGNDWSLNVLFVITGVNNAGDTVWTCKTAPNIDHLQHCFLFAHLY